MKKFTYLILLLFLSCKKEVVSEEIHAISLLSFGEVKKAGLPFKQNDILKYEEELTFNPKSFCELQVNQDDWVFRIKGEASFQLNKILEKDDTVWNLRIEQGTIQAKMQRKLRAKEVFRVVTPTALIGVRGTNFQVKVNPDGSTQVMVTEGQVAVQISPNVFSQKLSLSSALQAKEFILEKGKAIPITKALIKKLESLAEDKLTEVEKIFQEVRDKEIRDIPQNELVSLEQEISSLVPIPSEAFKSPETIQAAIAKRTTEMNSSIQKMMEAVSGIKIDTITLISGEELRGILEKNDKTFIIHTPTGKREFQESEVLEINPN